MRRRIKKLVGLFALCMAAGATLGIGGIVLSTSHPREVRSAIFWAVALTDPAHPDYANKRLAKPAGLVTTAQAAELAARQ